MMLLPRVSVDGEAADREQGEAQPDLEEAAVLADEAEVAKMPVNGKWELTFCVRRKACPLLVTTLRRIAHMSEEVSATTRARLQPVGSDPFAVGPL